MRKAKTLPGKGGEVSLSAERLQGKQSVRTTFRLPNHIIGLLNVVAFQLGLKQKSLFDQLVEDEDVLKKVTEKVLKEDTQLNSGERRQKTYVLSRRSLEVIEKISREKNISRDFIVEISIQRLLPVFNIEQEKHKNRSVIYTEMQRYLDQGNKLLKKAEHHLGEQDAICAMIQKSNKIMEQNASDLRSIIK